jgi:DNA repair protein RadC
VPAEMEIIEEARHAHDYWMAHIAVSSQFNLIPNAALFSYSIPWQRIKGHQIVALWSLDSITVFPRGAYRAVVVSASAAIILMHNHPSGKPSPSDADIRVTRDLIKAEQIMRIELLDHVVVGAGNLVSLKELEYFSV